MTFKKLDMYVGSVVSAEAFQEAKKLAYILTINFGALGIKKSSAQITNTLILNWLSYQDIP